MWKALRREGRVFARCTVARLMKAEALRGVVRGRHERTTIPDTHRESPRDLVLRDFTAPRPNQLWVADLTNAATSRGFFYVAFVIDVFARRMVGWRAITSLRSDLALDALEQAIHDRDVDGPLISHSDRGVQYLSICDTERLAEAGIKLSVGSRRASHETALAETIIGLYKTEIIYHECPSRDLKHLEYAILEWVSGYNTRLLMEPLDHLPPAEHEAQYQANSEPAELVLK